MGLFLAVIVGIGYFLSYYYGNSAILYVAIVFSVLSNVGSYWFSDKIVLALSRARKADETEYRELHRVLENLAITAGLPKPRLYVIDEPAPNAFATGRNKDHAAVAVTTGLLSVLDRSELEGVLAHELSHIGNRDILLSTLVAVLVGLIAILSDMFIRSRLWGFGGGHRDNRSGGGQAQAILMLVGVVFIVLSPIIATLIQLAISRKREFLADASGALLTRYPEGLASALKKISSYNSPMRHASNATAHLFISNPFGSRAVRGMTKLFMTHPPAEERVAALLGSPIS
ncbi:MAG: Protease HtpX-like protein [Parcubacteria group bacterium GW2011_GWF2_50_9]|nr:MAG: Protease HtpX-like protein [Parcubacteria group bacterium GW2011_GWF2_50_9]